jgi:hypothetical protein
MANHGVYVSRTALSAETPSVAGSGIPFVVGIAPVQKVGGAGGELVLINSFEEGKALLGYSDDWWADSTPATPKYTLCEFLYSHFKLYKVGPVIFKNVLVPSTMNNAVAAADLNVTDHKVELTYEAIDDANMIVKASGGTGSAYVKGTDYEVGYTDTKCVISLISSKNFAGS